MKLSIALSSAMTAASAVLLAALVVQPAGAQGSIAPLPRPAPGGVAAPAVISHQQIQQLHKAHQDDLEAMLRDMAKVQNADLAKAYESYLAGQLPKYLNNHKTLHNAALPAVEQEKGKGRVSADAIKAAAAVEKLSETHFPKLANEMARIEKLNPGLKRHFDVLRALD